MFPIGSAQEPPSASRRPIKRKRENRANTRCRRRGLSTAPDWPHLQGWRGCCQRLQTYGGISNDLEQKQYAVRTKGAGEHEVEGVLQAYDANNARRRLYNSESAKEKPGLALRLTMPMIANGRVYVPSHDAVYVYSLKD
jgi:hypothetical protein